MKKEKKKRKKERVLKWMKKEILIHFQTNTLTKGIKPLITPAMGYIASLPFFNKGSFNIK